MMFLRRIYPRHFGLEFVRFQRRVAHRFHRPPLLNTVQHDAVGSRDRAVRVSAVVVLQVGPCDAEFRQCGFHLLFLHSQSVGRVHKVRWGETDHGIRFWVLDPSKPGTAHIWEMEERSLGTCRSIPLMTS